MSNSYDIIIVGAGPAGLAAAIYDSWLGLKTLVLEAAFVGGRAFNAPLIENFPGFDRGIKGSELTEKIRNQALRFGTEIRENQEVAAMELLGDSKIVNTREQSYKAHAVIIATGTQRRKLSVLGEADFLGRGVSYCAVCDGPFFKNAKVAVIGNDDEAALEALSLSELASQVYLVTQESSLKVEGALLERLSSKQNIEIINGKIVLIKGEQTVKAIRTVENNQEMEHEVKGVFIALGNVPLTAVVRNAGVTVDKNGCLMVDRQQQTNIEGVFAAGDCTCGGMQVVTAVGEGAMAAMRASTFVRRKGK